MQNTINNVCDVTDHVMEMAFFVEYHGKQQKSKKHTLLSGTYPYNPYMGVPPRASNSTLFLQGLANRT